MVARPKRVATATVVNGQAAVQLSSCLAHVLPQPCAYLREDSLHCRLAL
jgi:hypothetical protein